MRTDVTYRYGRSDNETWSLAYFVLSIQVDESLEGRRGQSEVVEEWEKKSGGRR